MSRFQIGFLSLCIGISLMGDGVQTWAETAGMQNPALANSGAPVKIAEAVLAAYKPADPRLTQFDFKSIGACLVSGFTALGQGMSSGGKLGESALNGSLVGSSCTEARVPEVNSCDAISFDGVLDDAKVEALGVQIASAKKYQLCQQSKISGVLAHLSCLDAKAQDLKQWIETNGNRYSEAITKARGDLQTIEAVEESRKTQLSTLSQRLNGDSSGAMGLRQLKTQAFAYVTNQLPGGILQISQAQRQIDQARATIVELRKSEQARIAGECFRFETNRADFRCGRGKGDKPVSLYDFVLCRVEQNSYVGSNGRIEENASRSEQASNNRSGLQAILDSILRDMPIEQYVPVPGANGAPSQARISKANRVLTPADVEARFGAQLRRFNVTGFNTADIILKGFQSCYKRAEADVKVLETKPGERIYESMQLLKSSEEGQQTLVNKTLTEATEIYDSITKSLTGLSLPVDPTACRRSPPAQQIQCLQDLQKNMQDLVMGVGSKTKHVIQVEGTDPKHLITFNCNGVNGCIAAYESYYRAVDTEIKRVAAYKKTFVSQSNNNLNRITQDLQRQAGEQMKGLNDYMTQLNSALSQLGVDANVEFDKRNPEKPTYGGSESDDGTKIMDSPRDLGAFLGLPDLQGGNAFTKVRSAAAKRKKEISDEMTKVNAAASSVKALAEKCVKDQRQTSMKGLKADQERWRNARCGYLEYYSDKGASGGGSKLSELLASMNAIKGGGTLQTDLSSLKSGLSLPNNTTYINTVKQLDELKGQQADLEDKIRAARADLLTETDAEKKKSKKEILDQFTTQRTEILGNINNLREENKRVLGPQDPDETECDAILKDMKDKTDELSKLSRSKPGAGSAGSQTLGSPKSRYP